MNLGELRTDLQRTGLGTTAADVTSQNESLKAAYAWVWNADDWSFRSVDMGSLTVVAGTAAPTMPSDVGTVTAIYDLDGYPLVEMDADQFDTEFQPDNINGLRGSPSSYKIVNRQVTLGSIPQTSGTFRWSYERRVSHLTVGGVVTAGFMALDTSLPLWPADHHRIIVYHAAMVEHGILGYPTAATFQDLRDDALEAMREDLIGETAVGRQVPVYRP